MVINIIIYIYKQSKIFKGYLTKIPNNPYHQKVKYSLESKQLMRKIMRANTDAALYTKTKTNPRLVS